MLSKTDSSFLRLKSPETLYIGRIFDTIKTLFINISTMKYGPQYAGKWVAAKENKILASGRTLRIVKEKVKKENPEAVRFVLIPKGVIAG